MSRWLEVASRVPPETNRLAAAFAVSIACAVAAGTIALAGPVEGTAAPSILDPVPIDDEAPPVVRPPVTGVPFDGGVFVVVGVLAAGAILVRAFPRQGDRHLPDSVFAVLGEAPLAGPCNVRVVRFGPKTILLGLNGSACTALAEIDDAAVTAGIVADCAGAARPSPQAGRPRAGLAGALWACLGLRAGGVS